MRVRPPAFAGRFYPADPVQLKDLVLSHLAAALRPSAVIQPKALIVPHAGYVFSGPVAASGYVWLIPWLEQIKRVVLMGTCHTPRISGLAISSAEAFRTPLGTVPVDRAAVEASLEHPQVQVDDPAQNRDHALEVQLPFLQVVLKSFAIVPFLVGQADAAEVAEVLETLWDGDSTLILVSSDLSHHHPHDEARRLDQVTAQAIESFDVSALGPRSACGRNAIAGLLHAAMRHRLHCRNLDLRSSGDTAGPRDRVVGYGSWAFLPSPG